MIINPIPPSIWVGEGRIDPTTFEALWRPNFIPYVLNVDQYLFREVHQWHQKKHFEPVLKIDRVKSVFINEKQGYPYLTHRINPMLVSQVYMGPVPDMPLCYVWDRSQETSWSFMTLFQQEVPYKFLGGLWDWSHTCLSCMYGTSPMFCYKTPVGLVP